MLPDLAHGQWYSMSNVINLLDYWLDQLDHYPEDESTPRKLILFLEEYEKRSALVNRYTSTNNLDKVLADYLNLEVTLGPGARTFDALRFVHELKRICDRITSFNSHHSMKTVSIEIAGCEGEPAYQTKEEARMSSEEFEKYKFDWFSKERDRVSAGNIDSVLRVSPEARALVFIGTAHLMREQVDKADLLKLPMKSSKEHFLAHYLDVRFGRDSVTVVTANAQRNRPTDAIEVLAPTNEGADVFLPFPDNQPPAIPILAIPSKKTVALLLEGIEKYMRSGDKSDKALAQTYAMYLSMGLARYYERKDHGFRAAFNPLMRFFHLHLKDSSWSPDEFRRIGRTLVDSFDAVENIKDVRKWVLMTSLWDSVYYVSNMKKVIDNALMGGLQSAEAYELIPTEGQSVRGSFTKAEKSRIADNESKLIQLMLVKLMLVGTPAECEEASAFLSHDTDLKFTTATQWNRWWDSRLGMDTVRGR